MKMKHIEISPYNPNWPRIFEAEKLALKKALGDNCIAIHHIGSTSIPGMVAKKDIDILCVVNKLEVRWALESIGYIFKGEYNIPLRYYFSKNTSESKVNLHVVEKNHGFIRLNLCFRDYLRCHEKDCVRYSELKTKLLQDPKSFERNERQFSGYNLGKNAFIKGILDKAGWDGLSVNICMHNDEWDSAKHFRQKYFFDNVPISDPYTWTFDHPDHIHLVLYLGSKIIGYAHIQLSKDMRAAIRIIVIDKIFRNHEYGSKFLLFIEKWLKTKACRSIHTQSSPKAYEFYKKHGYIEIDFNDPDMYESDPQDIDMGKKL